MLESHWQFLCAAGGGGLYWHDSHMAARFPSSSLPFLTPAILCSREWSSSPLLMEKMPKPSRWCSWWDSGDPQSLPLSQQSSQLRYMDPCKSAPLSASSLIIHSWLRAFAQGSGSQMVVSDQPHIGITWTLLEMQIYRP